MSGEGGASRGVPTPLRTSQQLVRIASWAHSLRAERGDTRWTAAERAFVDTAYEALEHLISSTTVWVTAACAAYRHDQCRPDGTAGCDCACHRGGRDG